MSKLLGQTSAGMMFVMFDSKSIRLLSLVINYIHGRVKPPDVTAALEVIGRRCTVISFR